MYGRIRRQIGAGFGGDGLKAKAFKGGALLGCGSVAEQSARFGRNIILARLLGPEAFGTMAIAISAAAVVNALADVGVAEAVIRHPRGGERAYLNAAWWLALGRGIAIYSAIFVAAPWISRFYSIPELLPLLRITLLSFVFTSAMSPRALLAVKQMDFRRWALITHGGAICGVITTVILGFLTRNVWALAIGYCAEGAFRCVASYIVCPALPSLGCDKGAVWDLLDFSKKLLGSSFLNFVFLRADVFVLAKLYSPTRLGVYIIAVNLIQTPTSFIVGIFNKILLPTYAQVQNDNQRTNKIYVQLASLIVFVGLIVVIVAFTFGRGALGLIYGKRYDIASGPMIAAAFVAVIMLLNNAITNIFYARGVPQWHRLSQIIMATTMIAAIYPLTKWFGLTGGQLACLASMACGFCFQLIRLNQLTALNKSQYRRILFFSTGTSLRRAASLLRARREHAKV